ncbi:hypothetical protein POVCU1_038970, partial [Plasmodium ovale curtisi]
DPNHIFDNKDPRPHACEASILHIFVKDPNHIFDNKDYSLFHLKICYLDVKEIFMR